MLVCKECFRVFEYPEHCVNTHGLDYGPYEEYDCCPYCGGAYVEAHECSVCGEWIVSDYIKLANGERICEECYIPMELGDED